MQGCSGGQIEGATIKENAMMKKTIPIVQMVAMSFLLCSTVLAQEQPYICFAPGTSQEYMNEITPQGSGGVSAEFFLLSSRWTTTATNGSGLQQGDPTTITWSYLPDGTDITGSGRDLPGPSELFAWLNGVYENFDTWHALFVQAFEQWSQRTGLTFVYEPHDDGIAVATTLKPPGRLGVRGDIRIGAHHIDGYKGVLGYAYPPNGGEIVLDSTDDYLSDPQALRQVLAHEIGHALGLGHVCPLNDTKLMEPVLSLAFEGPQFDDILGAQRWYGDSHEPNETPGTATPLGAFAAGGHFFEDLLSVDGAADVNVYSFSVTGLANTPTVTVRPTTVAPYLLER
jgi:hypothetical protein